MSRKKMHRWLSLILAVSMLLILAACGQSKEGETAAEETSQNVSEQKIEEQKPAEIVTLEMFSCSANKSGLMEGWWTNILKEQVGVELELLPSGDQADQKLQVLMAGGELPDIVIFRSRKQVDDAARANLLLNLDENLDKLPNVVKNASIGLQFYRDNASGGSGKAFAIPNLIGPSTVGDEINWGPFLRWDLYKQLGMPAVKTLDDYLPLLKKMQELEPKNADGQKVYGISLWKDWDGTYMQQAAQPSCLIGIDTGDQLGNATPFLQVDMKTNETKSILDADSEYIKALKFYFKANQMGLVDPDSLTQRFDTATQKMEQGRILFAWWPWFVDGYNKPERINAESFKGFRPVLTEDYKAFWWGDNPIGSDWAFSVSASTKNKDACLKYVDFMYSTEGLMQLFNGPKGEVWDVNEKGEPYVTEAGWDIIDNQKDLPGGGKLLDGINIVNSYGLSGAFISPEYNAQLHYAYWTTSQGRKPSKMMEDWQTTTGYKTTSAMLKDKEMRTITPLAIRMVPGISDDMKTKAGQIGNVVTNNSWLMIFAKNEAEFDKIYKDMVEKAEGLGIQEVLDWGKEAWKKATEEDSKYNK